MIRSSVVGRVIDLLATGLEIKVSCIVSLHKINISLPWEASRPDLEPTQYFIQRELEDLHGYTVHQRYQSFIVQLMHIHSLLKQLKL